MPAEGFSQKRSWRRNWHAGRPVRRSLVLSFAFSTITARRGVSGSSASYGLYITVVLGVPLFAIAALATGQLFDTFDLSPEDMGMLAAAGVLHFLVGRYCNYRCIDAIGANRSQPLQATNHLLRCRRRNRAE